MAVDVFGAITTLLLVGNDDFMQAIGVAPGTGRTAAFGVLAAAAITALVVYHLGKGSNVARALVTIVMGFRILLGGWLIVVLGTHQLGQSLLIIAMAVTILALLWNAKASAFFATN